MLARRRNYPRLSSDSSLFLCQRSVPSNGMVKTDGGWFWLNPIRPARRWESFLSDEEKCTRGDSNSHGLPPTRTSSVRVCHFATSAGRGSISPESDLSLKIGPCGSGMVTFYSWFETWWREGTLALGYPMALSAAQSPLSVRERYSGALWASLVADSLTLPAHWIYDPAGNQATVWPDQ